MFAFFLHSQLKIFKFRFAQNEIFLKGHYEKKQRGFVLFAHFSFQNFAVAHFSSKRQPPIIVITKITIMASQKKKYIADFTRFFINLHTDQSLKKQN